MKKTFFLMITVVCGIISCTNTQQQIGEAKYVIDIDMAESKGAFEMSKLFKNVRTIILEESNENAIVGIVDRIQSFEDNIYILDRMKARRLFVFDRNGKYLRHIGSHGQGPGEYLGIGDFTFDPDKKEIYIMDHIKCAAHKYDITGKYIKSIKLPDARQYKNISWFKNKLYFNICKYENPDYLLMEVDTETEECRDFLSIDYNLGFLDITFSEFPVFMCEKESSLKYVEQYMNTVVAINGNDAYPYLTVKHKNWALKSDMLNEKPFNKGLDQHNIMDERSRAYNLHNYIENENYIYFEYFKGEHNNPVYYDKKTKQTSNFSELKNDLIFKKGSIFTIFRHINSKFVYDCPNQFIFRRTLRDIKNEKFELADNLDKRDELMNLHKLIDAGEERTIIFEYEFK